MERKRLAPGDRRGAPIGTKMKRLTLLVVCLLAFSGSVAVGWLFSHWRWSTRPDPPALITQLKDVARLEALDVTLYKKVSFEPDPLLSGTLWRDVVTWARYTVRAPNGRAIVFATAHLGLDLSHFDASNLRAAGDRVEVVLPPIQVQVELNPADTEIIGSNLDSAETAGLFAVAKRAFEFEVSRDAGLRERARRSAERAFRTILLQAGFREVLFVETLPLSTAL
jgi:hypothetical protein